jgi:transcriptional regulator with XRE-family HTH domain
MFYIFDDLKNSTVERCGQATQIELFCGGMLQVAQLRAARALLGWRQEDIAQAAKISVATVRRIESQEGLLTGYVSTLVKIQSAFEQAGVQFIDEDETGGFGLRIKKKRKR